MNTNNGALYFGAGIDTTQFRRDIDSMRRDILGLSQTTVQATQNMDSAFKNVFAGIAGYFSVSAIKQFVTELINVRGEFQKTEIAFATMLGDAGKAQALMGQMVDLAAKTPFSLQDVSSGAKQLLAFQIPANQVVDTLTRLGNIAAGLSVPLARINLVYGQVKAKGKLMGDDLRQFTEAGIPMVAELAKKFGKTTSEISAMVSAGKIGFKDVKDVLFSMTNEGGMFFNLMEKQSKSLSGQISNLGDTWDQMLNKIGESQEGVLSDGIQGLTYLVEHYQDVGKAIMTLVEIYGAYRAALIVTSILQGNLASTAIIQGFANLIKMIRGATVAQEALNAASLKNPYVLLATLIAALIAITYNYRNEIGELIGIIEKQTTAQKAQEAVMSSYNNSFGKGVSQTKANITELINIIRNENSSLDQRKQAYERLIAIDPTFRGTLDAQYQATRKLGEAMDYVVGKIDAFAMAQAKAAAARKYLEESFEEQFKAGALKTQVMDADAEAKKWRKLSDAAEKAGKASLDLLRKATAAEKKRDELAKKWREQQDIANEKGSISNTIIRNNNAEIAQDEKRVAFLKERIRLNKDNGEQIALYNKELEKLEYKLSGFKPEVVKDDEEKSASLGYVEQIEAKISELKDAYKKALTPAAARAINVEIAKWQAKLDALNPKKDKKDNKQLAEILPFGSPKQIQQQMQLLKEAMDLVENGMVKIRKLDKYGKDKDKKGNPYLTGEIITLEEAGKRYEELDSKLKAVQYKNFEETIAETKRQIEVRDKLLKSGYSKEVVDEMFPAVKDKSFLQYLNETGTALEKLKGKDSAENLVKLQGVLSDYTQSETFIENVNKQIDDLKAKFSGNELIDKLEKFKKANLEGTTGDEKNAKNIAITKAQQDELQKQKDFQNTFIKDKETFEQRKLEIESKYNELRKRILESRASDEEKSRLTKETNKDQAKEISSLSWEMFQKTDAYVKAFGDLEKVGPRALKKIREQFKAFIESEAGQKLGIPEMKALMEVYEKLDETSRNRNPFEAIGIAVDKYKTKRDELNKIEKESGKGSDAYQQKLDETKITFEEIVDASFDASKKMTSYFSGITSAIGGMSEELRTTISDVEQLVEGVYNAFKGFYGNKGQMITGIIQIVGSLSKIMNGDNQKEAVIKGWQKDIENLKFLYEQLNKEIEKTAGEASIKKYSELIANLKKQQQLLIDMRTKESEKKNPDVDKVDNYSNQIRDISAQVEELVYTFKQTVTTVEFKDLSKKLADALTEAFGQGEDAAKAFDKVVDDVMRNAVQNALKVKILEPAVQNMVDQLYSSMGFGNSNTSAVQSEISAVENKLKEIEEKLKTAGFQESLFLKDIQKEQLEKLKLLQQQLTEIYSNGSFDGLTQEERDKIKAMGEDAMKKYMEALKQYQDLFGQSAENAQGLKGDIKGITEKTAGALEGQFNAVRINISEVLKIMKGNQTVANAQTVLLSKIESNTSNLIQIRKDMAELNNKIKPGLAGIP
ncbi:tape measure protein [Chryseobacterium indologenes]|uniref:tape measure protein n=1 Tax=Chryseobacterium indologenes TaxID=253 RepID=UPI001BCCF4DB|nr:tape measure protein [Chryseobacterium indologenes]